MNTKDTLPDASKAEAYARLSLLVLTAPYLLTAWGVSMLTDERKKAFWITIGVVLIIRGIFALTEYWFEEINWRATGKKLLYTRCITLLRTNSFPDPSKTLHHDFLDYLDRLKHPVSLCDEAAIPIAEKEYRYWGEIMKHLPARQKKRYHATMDKAFLDWFGERWMKPYEADPSGWTADRVRETKARERQRRE